MYPRLRPRSSSLAPCHYWRWLRDACQCPSCVHPSTLQKLHRSSDVPADVRPAPGGLTVTAKDGVHVRWADGHDSFYQAAFLDRYASPSARAAFHRDIKQTLWNASSVSRAPDLFVPYRDLVPQPSQLLRAMNQLVRYGIIFLTGVPTDETANDDCELRRLANTFGELRTTFYGQLWDVKSVRDSRNIAYTNLDLGLHMDLLYFEHPPRYQILHCLRNRVVGGTSIFVDAFQAASLLYQTHPTDFDLLTTTPIPFHYINDGHHLHYEHPTIELDRPGTSTSGSPAIKYINYSPPFQAPLTHPTPTSLYTALGKFVTLLDDKANRMEYTLREGDAVLFDNRRVLHARTAFTDDSGGAGKGETSRWLKGCYLEADAVHDRRRMLSTRFN